MSLADKAARAAKKRAATQQQAAQAAEDEWMHEIATWISERTTYDPEFKGFQELALIAYQGDDPVLATKLYPSFSLDDVLVAYEPAEETIHLIATDEDHGLYLGPRVLIPYGTKWTKPQKQKRLVDGLARAMSQSTKHPAELLREHDAVCPTCQRPW